jgi:IS30 family transposase
MASFKTIYRWLYAGKLFHYQAGQKNVLNTRVLRQKGMRSGSSVREVIAATGDSIHNRPPEVENRSEFGHWEADTVVSPRGVRGACVATFLERQTRQFFAIQMPNRTAAAMNFSDSDIRRLSGRWRSSFAQRRLWQGLCDVCHSHQSPAAHIHLQRLREGAPGDWGAAREERSAEAGGH